MAGSLDGVWSLPVLEELYQRFVLSARRTRQGVWDFVRTHLKQLPVFVSRDGKAEVIADVVRPGAHPLRGGCVTL